MEFTTLASGSKGNCTLISGGQTKVLVDAGISAAKITNALKQLGQDIKDVAAVFVTHEHRDHIAGVRQLAMKYHMPVYASPKTWGSLLFEDELPAAQKRVFTYNMRLGELEVDFCKTSHDATQPVGMIFHHGERQLGLVTDTGCITRSMLHKLQHLDGILVEANHNVKMLAGGPYPYYLKKRIWSKEGHLSNVDAAKLLRQIIGEKCPQIVLAHLSETNNTPELALREVCQELKSLGETRELPIRVAPSAAVMEWVRL